MDIVRARHFPLTVIQLHTLVKHAAARLLFADGTADTTSGLRQQLVVATRAAHCCSTAGLEDRASSGWKYAEAAWRALSRRGAATACAVDGVRLRMYYFEPHNTRHQPTVRLVTLTFSLPRQMHGTQKHWLQAGRTLKAIQPWLLLHYSCRLHPTSYVHTWMRHEHALHTSWACPMDPLNRWHSS